MGRRAGHTPHAKPSTEPETPHPLNIMPQALHPTVSTLLGGSPWAVISGVLSPLIRVISILTLLITLLITTHEPHSYTYWASFYLLLGGPLS